MREPTSAKRSAALAAPSATKSVARLGDLALYAADAALTAALASTLAHGRRRLAVGENHTSAPSRTLCHELFRSLKRYAKAAHPKAAVPAPSQGFISVAISLAWPAARLVLSQ